MKVGVSTASLFMRKNNEEALPFLDELGVHTAETICENLRKKVKKSGVTDPEQVKGLLKEIVIEIMGEDSEPDLSHKPSVILVIGVNGVGKTTSIGKMAHYCCSVQRIPSVPQRSIS